MRPLPPDHRPFARAPLRRPLVASTLTCLLGSSLLLNPGGLLPAAPPPADATPRLTERRETDVNAVAFSSGADETKATGSTIPLTIRVEPNRSGSASVGVSEEYVSGTGAQWRAATWLATFNACEAAGIPITDVEVLVKTSGFVDGPSAGMLMTGTILALLRGDALRADTTMTGTINPDGTAGPVGGIPLKIEGAKEKGLKRFGFPIGCRLSVDPRTRAEVDVAEKAEREGLEPREIRDLYEAYTFLTGKTLPRPEPLADTELEPSSQFRSELNAKVQDWKAQATSAFNALRDHYNQFKGRSYALGDQAKNNLLATKVDPLIKKGLTLQQQAETAQSGGQSSSALQRYLYAAILFNGASHFLDLLEPILNRDLALVAQRVDDTRQIGSRVEAVRQELTLRARRSTIGGRVTAIAALQNWIEGEGCVEIANRHLAIVSAVLQKLRGGNNQNGNRNGNAGVGVGGPETGRGITAAPVVRTDAAPDDGSEDRGEDATLRYAQNNGGPQLSPAEKAELTRRVVELRNLVELNKQRYSPARQAEINRRIAELRARVQRDVNRLRQSPPAGGGDRSRRPPAREDNPAPNPPANQPGPPPAANGFQASPQEQQMVGAAAGPADKTTAVLYGQLYDELWAAFVMNFLAEADVQMARVVSGLAEEGGPLVAANQVDSGKLGRAYASAGTAAQANFDALVVDGLTELLDNDRQRAVSLIILKDVEYAIVPIAASLAAGADRLKDLEPVDRAALQLAAGSYAYLHSAKLLNKYYGLQMDKVQYFKQGVLSFNNPRALTYELDAARRNVLVAAARCREKGGAIPNVVRVAFQIATAEREGDNDDKVQALQSYWAATFYLNLAAQFATAGSRDNNAAPNPGFGPLQLSSGPARAH